MHLSKAKKNIAITSFSSLSLSVQLAVFGSRELKVEHTGELKETAVFNSCVGKPIVVVPTHLMTFSMRTSCGLSSSISCI